MRRNVPDASFGNDVRIGSLTAQGLSATSGHLTLWVTSPQTAAKCRRRRTRVWSAPQGTAAWYRACASPCAPPVAHTFLEGRCSGFQSATLEAGSNARAPHYGGVHAIHARWSSGRPRRGLVALSRQVDGGRTDGGKRCVLAWDHGRPAMGFRQARCGAKRLSVADASRAAGSASLPRLVRRSNATRLVCDHRSHAVGSRIRGV